MAHFLSIFVKRLMRQLFYIVTALFYNFVHGQNLVQNPSFEDTLSCPNFLSEISSAKYWDGCGWVGSPDFFYKCANSNSIVGVPDNWLGHQNPATGKGYAGIICYTSGSTNEREYIISKLTSTLVVGQRYYISFKVSKGDDSTLFSGSSTNKLGVRFRRFSCPQSQPTPSVAFIYPDNFAHFYSNTIITDRLNWTAISGSFIADSAYQYIVLGNFFKNAQTNVVYPGSTTNNGGYASYYYIDDVCVSSSSITCMQLSNVLQENKIDVESVILFPNPNKGYLQLMSKESKPITILIIENLQGEKLKVIDDVSENSVIDISTLENGIYIITIKIGENKIYKRITKI